jgi:curli biogenesis system outer membrane secretion channel CsgG
MTNFNKGFLPHNAVKLLSLMVSILCLSVLADSAQAQNNNVEESVQQEAAQDTKRPEKAMIAVMSYSDFVPDRTGVDKSLRVGMPDVLAGRMIEKLSANQRFTVVERKALRRTVLEQRFGQGKPQTYLDNALDKAIGTMEQHSGSEIHTTGSWSNYNDVMKDFQDLGSNVGADFIVLGDLEKLTRKIKQKKLPYSSKNLKTNQVDARLRLRVIDAKKGTVAGAASIKTKLSEQVFQGIETDSDGFTVYDHLAELAAAKILDVTFPARIVSLEPLVISRGSNDGVKVGDRFVIQHEGKEIRNKEGLLLARLKNKVGVVKVENSQSTIAIVAPVSGEGFQIDDLAEAETEEEEITSQKDYAKMGAKSKGESKGKGRPVIAMGMIKRNQSARTVSGFNKGHLGRISDDIITGLNDSKRFVLLEREQVDQVLDEKLFETMTSGGDFQNQLGELSGADYLIHGELTNFYTQTERKKVPYLDEVQVTTTAHAEGTFRIADVHTGAIISSEKVKIKEKIKNVKDYTQIISLMIERFSTQSVAQIVARLYPSKVLTTTEEGIVYINRGADAGIKEGDVYSVMRAGQELIDPDTGESFGKTERKIASIKIITVESARSQAEILSGNDPQRGDLIRKAKKAAEKPRQRVMQPSW